MTARDTFDSYAKKILGNGISLIDTQTAKDVYAISFYIFAEEDDPRRAQITVGFNTEENVNSQRESEIEEARWNYAFWLQNEVCTIPGDRDEGKRLWEGVLDEESLRYSEDQEINDYELVDGINHKIALTIVDIAVEMSKHCHSSGLIFNMFGKNIPIIIHELEYYKAVAIVTAAGNPPGVADDFIKSFGPGFEDFREKYTYPEVPGGAFYF